MKCPKCNTENPQEANFCRCCGYTISSEHNIYTENQRLRHENDRLKDEFRFFESSLMRERLKFKNEIENQETKIKKLEHELRHEKTRCCVEEPEVRYLREKCEDLERRLQVLKTCVPIRKPIKPQIITKEIHKCPVKTHVKYILSILLFIIIGVLSCYYIYNKEEHFKKQVAFYKPFEVLKISIKDDYDKGTNIIRYDEATFIKPHLTVVGFKDGRYKIKAKIYRNSVFVPILLHGWVYDTMILKRNDSSPFDCSFEGIYDIKKGVITQFDMKEFGYEERGHWAEGDYLIEFWYKNICLGKEEFKISKK